MKSLSAIALAILLIVPASNAQDRVRERDLEGTVWKMEFNLKEEGDGAFERIILNAVDGLMDEIDIQLEFGKRGHLSVWVDAFSRDEDEEEGDWRINRDGQLVLGDADCFSSDDTVWMLDGDLLVPFEWEKGRLERGDAISLRRIRK